MFGCAHCYRNRLRRLLCVTSVTLTCGAWFGIAFASARADPQRSPAVQRASYEREVERAPGKSVRFGRRAPQVGDQTQQSVSVSLRLDTIVRQGKEVLEQAKTEIRRRQRRLLTATEIDAGRAVAATVRYDEAKKLVRASSSAGQLPDEPETPQPVESKAYQCRRDDNELKITDTEGNIPPLDEFEIVSQNMESLGRPNVLAEYLAGRTVAVGQTIELPNVVAEKLLGLGDTLGEVTRFRLKLEKIQAIDGHECAMFHTSIDAASHDSSQMRLQVEGTLAVQTATSRAVQASLTGPIGMSETRGSLTATYQMTGAGRMTVDITSKYLDAAR